jgi:hypothetical protein
LGEFKIEKMAIRYSQFVPQLYNYCLSLGFERKKMMPSRAFCSDETQGYPAILLAQHFGTFPFDHGQVGVESRPIAIDRTLTMARTLSSYRQAMSVMTQARAALGFISVNVQNRRNLAPIAEN